ncbi:MAG: type II secretion system protein GspE [candidate division GAL15 bacterium]
MVPAGQGKLETLVTPPRKGKSARLGELLLERGLLTAEQLEDALAEQRRTGELLGRILVERGYVSKQALGEVLATQKGYEYVSLPEASLDEGLAHALPEWVIAQYRVIPLSRSQDEVVLGMVDPGNVEAMDVAAAHFRGQVRPVLITEADFDWVFTQMFGARHRAAQAVPDLSAQPDIRPGAAVSLDEGGEETPLKRLFNSLLADAIRSGATDIHVEMGPEDAAVRFRVDGLLREMVRLPHGLASALISRVKVLSGMDIGERVRPQDGRLVLTYGGREYDARVATVGAAFGERLTVRLLNTRQVLLGLDRLGLEPEQQKLLAGLLLRPYGMVLVTGPTGSGKTTTLYAALSWINDGTRNIVTVEDPVEYRMAGITQIPVREKMGVTFEVGLRALLRHDPDVIMVGEIRDPATASLAVHAALAGHLVLTTLHTNDAPSALVRLVDMGVEPFLLASAVAGVVGQRLVRVLCRACRRAGTPDPEARKLLGSQDGTVVYRPVGCPECAHTGYRGRVGVFEVLLVDEPVRERVLQRSASAAIAQAARDAGMQTLWESAVHKVLGGWTSVDELRRLGAKGAL